MTVAAPPESRPTPTAASGEPRHADVETDRPTGWQSRWRSLTRRDTATFARRWPGKFLVAVVLVTIPVVMALRSFASGRWIDNSWTVLAMAALLAIGYLASRRLVLTVLVATAVLLAASWVLTPRLASGRSGDAGLLSQLDADHDRGMLSGFHALAVAEIDLGARAPSASGGTRSPRRHPDGGRLADEGDDRTGHRRLRPTWRDPDGRSRLDVPARPVRFRSGNGHDARAQHAPRRLCGLRAGCPSPGGLEGSARRELPRRAPGAADRGHPLGEPGDARRLTSTPAWAPQQPGGPSRRLPG